MSGPPTRYQLLFFYLAKEENGHKDVEANAQDDGVYK